MLSPLLIPVALTYLPESYTPVQRWQTIFIGLSSAWFLAGLSWLFIDAGTPIDGPISEPH
jgi:hypothetical protein